MRQAGSIANKQDASRLAAYLTAQGVDAVAEPDGSQWAIWVRDEDKIAHAKEEIAQYLANPHHARYAGAEKAAAEKLRQETERRAQAQKNVRHMSGKWSDGRVVTGPLTRVIMILCLAVFLVTGLGESKDSQVYRTLRFSDDRSETLLRKLSDDEMARFEAGHELSPLVNIQHGEVWRLVTPIFLHLGLLHIIFNMWMFHQLASLIEARRGTGRMALMILTIAILSNLGQAPMPAQWGGNPYFGGMSGVVYGLLGYAWVKTRLQPDLGIFIRSDTLVVGLIWLVMCWSFYFIPGNNFHVANWAHTFGLVVGMAIAFFSIQVPARRS